MSSINAAKNALRQELKSRIASMTAEERARQSQIVTEKVCNVQLLRMSSPKCMQLMSFRIAVKLETKLLFSNVHGNENKLLRTVSRNDSRQNQRSGQEL